MQRQDLSTSQLHDWIDKETLPLDLVASWEVLCDTYDSLRFSDELTDSQRLEEFKWIIHQTNKFLSSIRKKLITVEDHEAALSILRGSIVPKGEQQINERKALVYQTMRQRWILMEIQMIQEMQAKEQQELTKGALDGWDEYGIA